MYDATLTLSIKYHILNASCPFIRWTLSHFRSLVQAHCGFVSVAYVRHQLATARHVPIPACPLNHIGKDRLPFRIQTSNAGQALYLLWLVFVWIIDALLGRGAIWEVPVGLAVTAPQVKEPSWLVGLVRVHVLRHGVPASAPLPFYALT